MLDNETKRRIDTARDILVGKVPDPKSQVEQITIALVYKFMDDMDKESVEMGGKASFFTGDYERYAWSKIFDPRIGGHEMLGLYGEAIVKLNQNPNIPQLFRDIFKNAYLPYRDPETLKLFLKTINAFSYDHSERLGDAFEYLLSVLGSQGDAGQFRTPRHIIDFMVQVVNPQKHEMILDPACGTAGFLISSYKHILKENTKKILGDLLTGEERKKLLTNFKGYDISPDMVRLSLVNLYLHGFVQPQIMEYDTLTSEDRWNEYADVIMANPPFMSPKGGIKPHKKFSLQSNRSEVLFVDYIVEHLTPTGRAAVIVPEGIIFQGAGAYKQLRKMLVENHLYAVVSLPAGIFNPYSGVKTSILLMDRQIAKKCDSILFVKIENDGFGLGAQRREQTGSDLPEAVNVISDYVKAARSGVLETFIPEEKPCEILLVTKEKLAENEEYNLTGDRYRIIKQRGKQKWPFILIDEVFAEIKNGKNVEQFDEIGKYRVSRIQTISDGTVDLDKTKWTNDEVNENDFLQEGDILLSHINSMDHLAKTAIFTNIHEKVIHGINLIRLRPDISRINPFFASRVLKSNQFIYKARSFAQKAVNQASIKTTDLKSIQIPLPPLEVQREIVTEIEGYQKLIDGARQVVDSWKPQIEIDPEWPMVKLGDEASLITKGTTPTTNGFSFTESGVSFIKVESISGNGSINKDKISFISDACHQSLQRSQLEENDILFSIAGTEMGISALVLKNNLPANTNQALSIIRLKENLNPLFVLNFLRSARIKRMIEKIKVGVAQFNLSLKQVSEIEIPMPSLNTQLAIVANIEAERKSIEGCKELITLYEAKIKKAIDKVWEE